MQLWAISKCNYKLRKERNVTYVRSKGFVSKETHWHLIGWEVKQKEINFRA